MVVWKSTVSMVATEPRMRIGPTRARERYVGCHEQHDSMKAFTGNQKMNSAAGDENSFIIFALSRDSFAGGSPTTQQILSRTRGDSHTYSKATMQYFKTNPFLKDGKAQYFEHVLIRWWLTQHSTKPEANTWRTTSHTDKQQRNTSHEIPLLNMV